MLRQKRSQWRRSGVFIVNFELALSSELASHLYLVFLLLIYRFLTERFNQREKDPWKSDAFSKIAGFSLQL